MKQIGQYRVDRPLGAGDYSEVFRCLDGDVPVAVKVFRIRSTRLKSLIRKGDGELTARLRRIFVSEATLLASFSHRHIVDVKVRSTLPDGSPYFVMPFLPHDLAKDIWPWKSMAFANTPMVDRRVPPKPQERVISLLRHILSALSVVHDRGIVHRGVKPQNVLIDNADAAVLCDFGEASLTPLRGSLFRTTYGSIPFASPEQRGDPSTIDASTDIYSVGVIAHIMLTGRAPQSPETPTSDRLQGKLGEWVMLALAPDPAPGCGESATTTRRRAALSAPRMTSVSSFVSPIVD